MTNKKIISAVSVILIFTLCLSVSVFSAEPTTNVTTTLDRANALKDLGLFMGSGSGFDLESAPTRTQAIVLLLRMLGEEKAAQNSSYTCPFTDVPSWALKSIAYAYNKGYTSGTSTTTFGANDIATPAQFFTFMLRALGYSDRDGDFIWSESVQKAESLGIIPVGKYTANGAFIRGDIVDSLYRILSESKKGETTTLAESLIASGAIDSTIAAKYGFLTPKTSSNLVDLTSKTFSSNEMVSILTSKSLWANNAMIRCLIIPSDQGIKVNNIYLSIDGINFEKLQIRRELDWSNSETPYVYNSGASYNIVNLQFSTTYTVCVESEQNGLITPVTVKTADAQAASVSGYGSPWGSKSKDDVYTSVSVGLNLSLEGNWSYQFYRWAPGMKPTAIPNTSGVANGSAVISYEPTSDDLNNYVFWRVTNADGIIIENAGWHITYIAGSPVE